MISPMSREDLVSLILMIESSLFCTTLLSVVAVEAKGKKEEVGDEKRSHCPTDEERVDDDDDDNNTGSLVAASLSGERAGEGLSGGGR